MEGDCVDHSITELHLTLVDAVIRMISRILVVAALFTSFQNIANAQDTCVVKGSSLANARSNYAAQCTLQRVDCDPFNGEWYCASYRLTSSVAPALTNAQPTLVVEVPTQPTTTPVQAAPPAPVVPAPVVIVTPVVPVAPTPTAPVVTTTNIKPACVYASSDPDNDGWGWENNLSCRVVSSSIRDTNTPTNTPATPDETPAPTTPAEVVQPSTPTNTAGKAPSDITDLILVTGQSNALGAGTSYNPSLDSPNSNVFAFTNSGWQVANLNQIWDLNWHPRNHPETDPSNNFALHFGKTVATRDSSKVIGFILASNPGAKISSWNYNSSFYNTLQAKALDAINQLPHKSALDGILWHQGESDGEDKQYYTDALYGLIYNLRNEPWVKSNAPFICGETKINSVNKRLNGLNTDSDPTTACVAAEDLSTRGDDRHFDARALRTLGSRYGNAYLDIVR